MSQTRGWLPDDVAIIPAGLDLAAAVADVDRSSLSDEDLIRLAQARQRLAAHVQAQLLADLHAIGQRVDTAMCQTEQERQDWAETEIAMAMTWTARRAGGQLWLADQLVDRLPAVLAALDAGDIDVPKAMVFADETMLLDAEVARRVADQVLGQAPGLTTGQLAARLRKAVLAADTDAVRKKAKERVKGRRVEAQLTADGLAELCGYDLPPHLVAAAAERLTAFARAAKAAGDRRKMDQLRADAFCDLLIGQGVALGGPITQPTLGTPDPHTDPPPAPAPASPQPTPADHRRPEPAPEPEPEPDPEPAPAPEPELELEPEAGPVSEPGPQAGPVEGDDTIDPDHEELAGLWTAGFDQLPTARPQTGCPTCGTPTERGAMPAPRKGVVDLQVPLTTLMGLTDFPGDLAGYGPVIADIARQVIAAQIDATWRCSVYDEQGKLIHHGITRRRPKAQDVAYIKARDRTCRAPGCRRAARQCDVDHTDDWAKSKDSCRCNLACPCRKHHLFKHLEHSGLIQLGQGVLAFRTPLGQRLITRPKAYTDELKLALLGSSLA
jgi:Domain of unknown function (DUF222)